MSYEKFIIQHAKLLCPCEQILRIIIYGECVTEICEVEKNCYQYNWVVRKPANTDNN